MEIKVQLSIILHIGFPFFFFYFIFLLFWDLDDRFQMFVSVRGLSVLYLQGMDDMQVRSAATDIFSYLVEYNPSMVREFVMQEAQQNDDVSKKLTEQKINNKVNIICTNSKYTWGAET